jgi:hypothetical protein
MISLLKTINRIQQLKHHYPIKNYGRNIKFINWTIFNINVTYYINYRF